MPSPQQSKYWLTRLRKHLVEDECLDDHTVENHICGARVFLRYLASRKIELKSVMPADLQRYLNRQRQAYRSRHGHGPYDDKHWRSYYTAPIHHLLRVVQGVWPPTPDFQKHLDAMRGALQRDGLADGTIRTSLKHARRFLHHLTAHNVRPEQASLSDVDEFLESAFRVYRRTVNPPVRLETKWRCRYRREIQRLLECVQGEWPPPSAGKTLLQAFQEHLAKKGIKELDVYARPAQLFIDYLEQRNLDAAQLQPSDVADYFRVALKLSKRRHPGLVTNPDHWRRMCRRTVYAILRFVQGEWPPGSHPPPLLGKFREHLEERGYNPGVISFGVAAVNQFLRYLRRLGKPTEAARRADVAGFIEEKRKQYEKRHGGAPPCERKWRSGYTGPIHRMLRLVDPDWPRPDPPIDETERFQRGLLEAYGCWLIDDHGLSQGTLKKNGDEAKRFLSWLSPRDRSGLRNLTVANLDAYLAWRLPLLRRHSRHGVCDVLRSFLRFLHSGELLSRDLSLAVTSPKRYQFEEIPRVFSQEQIRAVLRCTRLDRSPIGLRDYAILLLLATYGMRAGEVTGLRLEDIDWRQERLRICHSKTGHESFVPLVAPVGEALLNYLQRGRPTTSLRQVFLQAIAPYQAFQRGGSLCTIIRYRLQDAGVKPKGHQGAHAFRYARAHSLLCASVSIKAIGDLLGHRSADSTKVYLKLVTDDLREIGLELPGGKKSCRTGPTRTKRS